jgi:hypothetical protein
LSARVTVSPDIFTGFTIGRLTAMGSIPLILTLLLNPDWPHMAAAAARRHVELYRDGPHGDKPRRDDVRALRRSDAVRDADIRIIGDCMESAPGVSPHCAMGF